MREKERVKGRKRDRAEESERERSRDEGVVGIDTEILLLWLQPIGTIYISYIIHVI